MTAPVVHRLSSYGHLVCGFPRRITDKVTSLGKYTTCEACKARRAAFKKSGKIRGAMYNAKGTP